MKFKNILESIYYILIILLLMVALSGLVVYGAPIVLKSWDNYHYLKMSNAHLTNSPTDTATNVVGSEVKNRFFLTSHNKTAIFYLNITTNQNKSYLLGQFEMDYKHKKVLPNWGVEGTGHGEESEVIDIFYKVPENWIIKQGVDFNVTAKYKTHIENAQKDPTFKRGRDYPESIPFDEIEMTTDFVYIYTDTNETEYNFRLRVSENQPDFNIVSAELIVPKEYTVREA